MKHLYAANVIHVMDKDNIPAITIGAGETIAVETAKPGIPDETFTKDYSVEPYPRRILSITGRNLLWRVRSLEILSECEDRGYKAG